MERIEVACCNDCSICELARKPSATFNLQICMLDQIFSRVNKILDKQEEISARLSRLEEEFMETPTENDEVE